MTDRHVNRMKAMDRMEEKNGTRRDSLLGVDLMVDLLRGLYCKIYYY